MCANLALLLVFSFRALSLSWGSEPPTQPVSQSRRACPQFSLHSLSVLIVLLNLEWLSASVFSRSVGDTFSSQSLSLSLQSLYSLLLDNTQPMATERKA